MKPCKILNPNLKTFSFNNYLSYFTKVCVFMPINAVSPLKTHIFDYLQHHSVLHGIVNTNSSLSTKDNNLINVKVQSY